MKVLFLSLILAGGVFLGLVGFCPGARQQVAFCTQSGILSDWFYPRVLAERAKPYDAVTAEEMIDLCESRGWRCDWAETFRRRLGLKAWAGGFPPYIDKFDACYPALALAVVRLFPCSDEGALAGSLIGLLLLGLACVGLAAKRDDLDGTGVGLAAAAAVLSFPTLYGVERGQLVLFAAAGVATFLATRESKGSVRELGVVALAVASVLKITPGVFALVLVRERKWQDLAVFAVVSAVLFFVPFAWYGGVDGFFAWMANASENGRHYVPLGSWGFVAVFRFVRMVLGLSCEGAWTGLGLARILSVTFGLVALWRYWKAGDVFFLVMTMLLVPGNMNYYTGVYLVVALLVGRWNKAELCAWFVILCALQLPYGAFSVNRHLANVVLLGMAMWRGWRVGG